MRRKLTEEEEQRVAAVEGALLGRGWLKDRRYVGSLFYVDMNKVQLGEDGEFSVFGDSGLPSNYVNNRTSPVFGHVTPVDGSVHAVLWTNVSDIRKDFPTMKEAIAYVERSAYK